MKEEPESVKVLHECIDLQLKKARDYQNPASSVKQADYYLNGIQSIYDIMHGKMLRILSVLETRKNDPEYNENFESLEDSFKDLINYSSFAVSYYRKKIPGQTKDRDVFNRPAKKDPQAILKGNDIPLIESEE